MKVKVEIDTDDILEFTSRYEESEIANSFLDKTSDEALVSEVVSRGLIEEVLDEVNPDDRLRIINYYLTE